MSKFLSGDELRQWARKCLTQAHAATNDIEHRRLTKMHDGLMEMARTQDWLDGLEFPSAISSATH